MKVPLLDLGSSIAEQRELLLEAVAKVIDSQRFIMGPEVEALEASLAEYVGARFAISCANGSDALLLALLALDVGPGDEVVTTPFTFFATAGSIARVGARPVFVDIEPGGFNIDLGAAEAAITSRTRALLPVHLFGQTVDLDGLGALGKRSGVPVVEDAAQALGARWGTLNAGAVGAVATFSFYPSKNLGAFGDGGLMTTSDEALRARLASLRQHGNYPKKYHHKWIGMNSRLDALQAAILRVRLPSLDAWHAARRANAAHYRALFGATTLHDVVTLPAEAPQAFHIYNQFCIRAARRDELQRHLTQAGIGTEVYYPVPMHLQECFAYLGYRAGDFPESERAAAEALALPIGPGLGRAAQHHVVAEIARFYGRDVPPLEVEESKWTIA